MTILMKHGASVYEFGQGRDVVQLGADSILPTSCADGLGY